MENFSYTCVQKDECVDLELGEGETLTIPSYGYYVSVIDYGGIIPHDAVLTQEDSDCLAYDIDVLKFTRSLTGTMIHKDLDKLMRDTREADPDLYEKIKSTILSEFPVLDFDAFDKGEKFHFCVQYWFHRLLEALNKPLACSLCGQPLISNSFDGSIIFDILLSRKNLEPIIKKLANMIM